MTTCTAILLAAMTSTPAGITGHHVQLAIVLNGQAVQAPEHATIIVDGTAVDVPIVNGVFEVPPEIALADRVDFGIELPGEKIRIPRLRGGKFLAPDWTLLLADRRYEDEYQSELPSQFKVKRSCLLLFDSPDAEPTIYAVDNCRTRSKKE